jgi:glycosyltransferase involved in cell wall biosynthesis
LWWVQRWAAHTRVPVLIHAFGLRALQGMTGGTPRMAKHFAVASATLAAALRARVPRTTAQVRVIRPAIAARLRHAAAHGPDRAFGVLCVCPLAAQGGVELLLDAVAALRRPAGELVVAILGVGPARDALWRQVRQAGLQETVSLLDEPQLWEKILPDADALVLPACQPELSVVPLFAMATRKIVIASRDQPAEWFIDGRTAWQFTPGSAAELSYLLERALTQPKPALELTAAAADYVREHHTIRTLVTDLLTCYGDVVRDHHAVVRPEDAA